MVIISLLVTALFAVGAVMTYRERGWNWVSIGLACMTVLSAGGIVENLFVRVKLTDDALVIIDFRGQRRYPKADITGVQEAKGVSPVLLLTNGRWVSLPSVGDSIGNSIRAWLKHEQKGGEGAQVSARRG